MSDAGNAGKPLRFVKLRNPWGNGEWKGLWSDEHIAWDCFPEVKRELEHTNENDGIFWMQWLDFQEHYGYVTYTVDVPEKKASPSSGSSGTSGGTGTTTTTTTKNTTTTTTSGGATTTTTFDKWKQDKQKTV